MPEGSVIFALLTEKPPNGKLPVLSVYSFAVLQRKRKNDHRDIFMIKLKERMLQRPKAASLMTDPELPHPIFKV